MLAAAAATAPGDVGYFNGIVRIGRFDTSMDQIERQCDTFQAKIERA